MCSRFELLLMPCRFRSLSHRCFSGSGWVFKIQIFLLHHGIYHLTWCNLRSIYMRFPLSLRMVPGSAKLPMGPAIIGVSEIENYRVLEDILKQPALADRGYRYVHYEGEDQRGVDCAFFYNPKLFELTNSKLVPYVYINDTVHKTRGFLIASGNIADEKMHFIVNHWPSRAAASPARERAGEQVRAIKDSLLREDSAAKIVIMGDMNDDPMDKSMAVALGAKRKPVDAGPTDLYNPWWDTLKKGYGTLMYKGKWNLFDQIVFTGNLLGTDRSTLKFYKHEIFSRDFMFQKEGKYKGYPKRTQAGGVWLNGYSDHLPTIIYLIKEVK